MQITWAALSTAKRHLRFVPFPHGTHFQKAGTHLTALGLRHIWLPLLSPSSLGRGLPRAVLRTSWAMPFDLHPKAWCGPNPEHSYILQEKLGQLSLIKKRVMQDVAVVYSPSRVRLFVTPWTATHQASLFLTISRSLPKFMFIESVRPFNHLILCHPLFLLLFCPVPGSFPMNQLFTSGGQSIRASASTTVLLVSIQGWFPLGLTGLISLQSKELSKSLLQHHSSKTLILRCSDFFMVQLSHPYMTTGKTIALPRQTFDGKVMSLLFT